MLMHHAWRLKETTELPWNGLAMCTMFGIIGQDQVSYNDCRVAQLVYHIFTSECSEQDPLLASATAKKIAFLLFV
jgi:hypothetical protein